jgi:hypothetical protein
MIHSRCWGTATRAPTKVTQTFHRDHWRFPSGTREETSPCTRIRKTISEGRAFMEDMTCPRRSIPQNGKGSNHLKSAARCSKRCWGTCRVSTRGSATTSRRRRKFVRACAFGSFVTAPGSVGVIAARNSLSGTEAGPVRGSESSPQTCAAAPSTIAPDIWAGPR